MDNKIEILLGSEKNVNSINVDEYCKIELINNVSEINEFTVNDVVNSTLIFDAEREKNQIYRLYGRIEYMSLLNGLKINYSELSDFFNSTNTGNTKTIINSFDFYLVAASSGETFNNISGDSYQRVFNVIADKNDFELYNAGFSNNVYDEQIYSFNFKSDFDVENYFDSQGFPLTELFIYAQYKQSGLEEMSYTTWSNGTGLPNKMLLYTKSLNVGDILTDNDDTNITDIVNYIPDEYVQEQIESQQYYIQTNYSGGELEWTYNPLIPLRLRYLDGVISTAALSEIIENTSTLSVEIDGTPLSNFTATKSLKKPLVNSIRTIDEWDDQSSTSYNWNNINGELLFTSSNTYNINFQTEIRLQQLTDKYIGETYLEEYVGGTWNEVSNTRRKHKTSNPIQFININKLYNIGEGIRIRVLLIPNSDERKVYEIPDYAKMIEVDGKYVWRDILPQGYTDPTTNLGVDYPFLNKRRYLFETIVFDVIPNLSEEIYNKHQNTINVFDEISYYNNAISLDLSPTTEDDLKNIGKPCQ